jgi:serine/threonine-protein kinase
MPFVIGETIGPYQLVDQLGLGGMALVFKAYHPKLDRFVAIKVLHQAFTDDSNFLARFQREARVVAQLDHPNIVPIYDYSEYEGRPYLVMKFIEGETLKARLERGPLTSLEVMQIVNKIGAALSYAHAHKVLHRDIKPSNVLLSKDGQIYLADFGLARIAQSSGVSLTSDRFVGTPQYIPPEQAMSKSDLDARTGIYSFGVMLYEMLVGRVPFSKHPLLVVGLARYELLYGDQAKANNQISAILANPILLGQFPEAHLVEIELHQRQNDISGAQQLLQTLQAQTQLPNWIQ